MAGLAYTKEYRHPNAVIRTYNDVDLTSDFEIHVKAGEFTTCALAWVTTNPGTADPVATGFFAEVNCQVPEQSPSWSSSLIAMYTPYSGATPEAEPFYLPAEDASGVVLVTCTTATNPVATGDTKSRVSQAYDHFRLRWSSANLTGTPTTSFTLLLGR